jgi:gamma-glutamyl-gamma-aminobutyrate hydrolase PuuD
MYIHLTLVPYIGHAGELKTKPTQHSVNELRRIGIAPDMVVCRSEGSLGTDIRRKIALFASLPEEAVVSARDVDNIYKVPLVFRDEGVDDFVLEHFHTEAAEPDLAGWRDLTTRADEAEQPVRIALVGKYVRLEDAYLSVVEALRHSGFMHGGRVEIDWVDSEKLEPAEADERLGEADGILIPGGFGGRGIEGKIAAARIARENDIPYLGICLGMQLAVCEFARHATGMEGANSTEFDPETPFAVIDLLPEQKEVADMGGTMRLGADPIKLHDGTRAREIYDEAVVYERHRHRYEVNNLLRKRLEAAGMVFSGTSPDDRLVEVIELPANIHPFFVASQYHPEFKSRPDRPAPLFREFVRAAFDRARGRASEGEPTRSARPRASRRSPARSSDVRHRAGARAPQRPLRRALPDRQPVRPRARLLRSRRGGTARRRPRGLRGRRRPGGRLGVRKPPGPDRRARRGANGAPVRPPRHGRPAGADRARAGRGRLGERPRGDSRRRQQGGRRGAARAGPAPDGAAAPGERRAAPDRVRGERAARGQGVRRLLLALGVRLRV